MDILDDFREEGRELLQEAEEALLNVEDNKNLDESYRIIFRSFHSLKGGAGMIGLETLQSHMHLLEDFFSTFQGRLNDLSQHADYFLRGVDQAKNLLEGGELNFKYYDPTEKSSGEMEEEMNPSLYLALGLKAAIIGAERPKSERLRVLSYFKHYPNLKSYLKDKNTATYDIVVVASEEVSKEISREKRCYPFVLDDDIASGDCYLRSNDFTNANFIKVLKLLKSFSQVVRHYERSTTLLMYQFVDLEDYLIEKNKEMVRNTVKTEIHKLLEFKQSLKGQ